MWWRHQRRNAGEGVGVAVGKRVLEAAVGGAIVAAELEVVPGQTVLLDLHQPILGRHAQSGLRKR